MKYLLKFDHLVEKLKYSFILKDLITQLIHFYNDKIARILDSKEITSLYPDSEDINDLDIVRDEIVFLPLNRRPTGKSQPIKPGKLAKKLVSQIVPEFKKRKVRGQILLNDPSGDLPGRMLSLNENDKCTHSLLLEESFFSDEELKFLKSSAILPFDIRLSYRKSRIPILKEIIDYKLQILNTFYDITLDDKKYLKFEFNYPKKMARETGNLFTSFISYPFDMELEIIPVSDRDIELFATRITAITKQNLDIIQVSGEKIRFYYNKYNSMKVYGRHTVWSCMAEPEKGVYLDLYCKNPNQVKLLVMVNDESKLLARALLWKINKHSSGAEWLMDIIYSSHPIQKEMFVKYASEKGYLHLIGSYYYKGNQKTSDYKIAAKLDKVDFNTYPFVDTLQYLDLEESLLMSIEYYLEHTKEFKNNKIVRLNSVQGNFEELD